MTDVTDVNCFTRFAALSDGTTVPVTNLFDADGDETNDVNAAVTFVAGEGDQWFSGRCDDYVEVLTQ